jgi:hypothetical protein
VPPAGEVDGIGAGGADGGGDLSPQRARAAGGADSIEGGTGGGIVSFASAGAAFRRAVFSGAALTITSSTLSGNLVQGGADSSDCGAEGGGIATFTVS